MRAHRGLGAAAALALAGAVLAGPAHAWPWSKDMRQQPSVKTQHMPVPPPDGSVGVGGLEVVPTTDSAQARLRNPVAASPASLQRGAASFQTYCMVCHGKTATGNGPIAAKYVPPPNLLGALTRGRTDGYIYGHIRAGGPIMPSYRFALSAEQAWDLVNYIRAIQRQHPAP